MSLSYTVPIAQEKMKKILRVALGDLGHRTIGKHSTLMPLGIGFIASYLKKQMGDSVQVRLFKDPNLFLDDFDKWKPEVIGLTNFMWNAQLNQLVFEYVKKSNPSAICVAGGPEFPLEPSLCENYLQKSRCIDFYAYLEGEHVFSDLMQQVYSGVNLDELKSTPRLGMVSLHPKANSLIFNGPSPRISEFDSLPSPYLTGIMDQWFDGTHSPSIQTARGCPNSCTFCRAGNKIYGKVVKFPLERVKGELSFVAERMEKYPSLALYIVDSNFGLFERDEEISRHIGTLQDRYGWPNAISLDTDKNFERVLRMSEFTKKKMDISCSFQSLNPETLKAINRKNVNISDYNRMINEIKKRKMKSVVNLIIPLPFETRKSFMKAIALFYSSGADSIVPFTHMMLPGTEITSKEVRKKFGMQTRFRIIPRQFGEYKNKKCFEIEEVCVATSTMSFDDYLECRGFALLCTLFADKQYRIIEKHIKDLSIDKYAFINTFLSLVRAGETPFSVVYNEFIRETRKELFDSPQDLFNTLSSHRYYGKLLKGDIGDNLLRKYKIKTLSKYLISFVETSYKTLEVLLDDNKNKEIVFSLEDAKKWLLASGNIADIFLKNINLDKEVTLKLSYDVYSWYCDDGERPLKEYNYPVKYRMFYDIEQIRDIIERSRLIHAKDREFSMARTLLEYRADIFWRKCEKVNV